MVGLLTALSAPWLVPLADWSVGPFVIYSLIWSVGWSVDPSVGQRLGQLVARLIGPLTGLSVDTSACWSVNLLIGHSSIPRSVLELVDQSLVGPLAAVLVSQLICWSLGLSVGLSVGRLVLGWHVTLSVGLSLFPQSGSVPWSVGLLISSWLVCGSLVWFGTLVDQSISLSHV